jgi:hypothetical protein
LYSFQGFGTGVALKSCVTWVQDWPSWDVHDFLPGVQEKQKRHNGNLSSCMGLLLTFRGNLLVSYTWTPQMLVMGNGLDSIVTMCTTS